MTNRRQYRGMSVKEIGELTTLLFACSELAEVISSESISNGMVAIMQELFTDTFPEAPVILGMTSDLLAEDLDTDSLPGPFVEMLGQLGAELRRTFSLADGKAPDWKTDPLAPGYPAVGQAFVNACRAFPEDLDMDDPEYAWDRDWEDFEVDSLFAAAEEAEENAMDALIDEDEQLGMEIMSAFDDTGNYCNDEDEVLWARVKRCLDRCFSSDMLPEVPTQERDYVEQALSEMAPEFVEYFLANVSPDREGKILMFPGQGDKRTRMIELLEKTFLDGFMREIMAEEDLELMQHYSAQDPQIRHILFFGMVGILLDNGYFDDDDDVNWSEFFQHLGEDDEDDDDEPDDE